MSDIVFQEERSGVVLIERESGRREWYWAREIPDAEAADLNFSDHSGMMCMACGREHFFSEPCSAAPDSAQQEPR